MNRGGENSTHDYPVVNDVNKIIIKEETKERKEYNHHESSVTSVLFFSPNIIVTSSYDTKIVIFDLDRQEKMEEKKFSSLIYHMIKLSFKSFIACSYDKLVRVYSFDNDLNCILEYERNLGLEVNKLLKLNENLVLAVLEFGKKLLIIDILTNKMKDLNCESIGRSFFNYPIPFGFLLSKNNSDHFYISTSEKNIKKIDYKNNKTIKIFDTKDNVYFLESFLRNLESNGNLNKNSSNCEILIAGYKDLIFFYNTDKNLIMFELETSVFPYSSSFENNILTVGGYYGQIEIYSFHKRCRKIFGPHKLHGGEILDLKIMNFGENRIQICSGSSDKKVLVSVFSVDSDFPLFKEIVEEINMNESVEEIEEVVISETELINTLKRRVGELEIENGILKKKKIELEEEMKSSYGQFTIHQDLIERKKNEEIKKLQQKLFSSEISIEKLKLENRELLSNSTLLIESMHDNSYVEEDELSIVMETSRKNFQSKKISEHFNDTVLILRKKLEGLEKDIEKLRGRVDGYVKESKNIEKKKQEVSKDYDELKLLIEENDEIKKWVRNRNLENFGIFYFLQKEKEKMSGGSKKKKANIGKEMIYFGEIGMLNDVNVADGFGFVGIKLKSKKTRNLSRICPSEYFFDFIGEFKNGLRHGYGREFNFEDFTKKLKKPKYKKNRYELSIKYEGSFEFGEREGSGLISVLKPSKSNDYTSMIIFEGEFKNGKKNGKGESFDGNCCTKGTWIDGKINSEFSFKCPIIPFDSFNPTEKYFSERNKIGFGGYGSVYEVKSSQIKKISSEWRDLGVIDDVVAIKMIEKNLSVPNDRIFRMLKGGVSLCSRVKNKHLINVYAIVQGGVENRIGCIMEKCECSVLDLFGKNDFTIAKKKKYLLQTAKGILSLHKEDLMHRDLKWGNVLVSKKDGTIKITDFDTVRDSETWRALSVEKTSLTGTIGYMAPEVSRGRSYNLKCDVFSFGIMIFSLFKEIENPFKCFENTTCSKCSNVMTKNNIGMHIAECQLRPFSERKEKKSKNKESINKEIPEDLISLMERCWDDNSFVRPDMNYIVEFLKESKKDGEETSGEDSDGEESEEENSSGDSDSDE